jgi:ketosteroid isomerase-like protein
MNTPALTPQQTIEALYGAFGRGDLPGLLAMLSPDVQWRFVGAPGLDYVRTAQGRDDVARWFGQVLEAEDIQVFEPREFFAGPDHVTVLGFERTQSRRAAGGTFETEWVHLFTLKDGLVTRFFGLYDTAAAAAAHGVAR